MWGGEGVLGGSSRLASGASAQAPGPGTSPGRGGVRAGRPPSGAVGAGTSHGCAGRRVVWKCEARFPHP